MNQTTINITNAAYSPSKKKRPNIEPKLNPKILLRLENLTLDTIVKINQTTARPQKSTNCRALALIAAKTFLSSSLMAAFNFNHG